MKWHDDQFTSIDGRRTPYFFIGYFEDKYIIQHPYMNFGSLFYCPDSDHLIYHNKYCYSIKNDFINIINKIIKCLAKYYSYSIDKIWFGDTGYWNILNNKKSFFGYRIKSLKLSSKIIKSNNIAISFIGSDFILNIYKSIEKESDNIIDVYVSNEYNPFIEVIESFQKCCSDVGAILDKDEIIKELDIRKFWKSEKGINIKPVTYIMDKEYKMLPIIRNPFKRTSYKEINKLEYICGTTRGGFIDSEYDNDEVFFRLDTNLWRLESVSLLEFLFTNVE